MGLRKKFGLAMKRKPLGQILLELGVVTDDQLKTALAEQKQWRHPLGRTLIELGMVDEETIVRVLSHQLKLPAVQIDAFHPAPDALKMLDVEFCRQNSCMPLRYHPQQKLLHIAMSDHHLYDQIRVRARCNLRPYLAGPVAIERAIQRIYLGQQIGVPQMRSDENVLDLGEVAEGRTVSGEPYDPAEYYDFDVNSFEHPADGDSGPAYRRQPTEEEQALRDLRREVKRLRQLIARVAEILIAKGICVPDEIGELLRTGGSSNKEKG